MIDEPWLLRLHAYLGGIVRSLGGTNQAIGGTRVHVHLLVGLKATHRLADFVRDLKKGASMWVHDDIKMHGFAWQEGYAALTVSPSGLEEVREYIENQEQHHRQRGFQEELRTLLRRIGIEVDERYFD